MNWQQQLRDSVKSPEVLLNSLGLCSESLALSKTSGNDFPLRVTQSFIRRMERNNPHDPLLRQVLPLLEEEITSAGFSSDPVGEQLLHTQDKTPGILHKYHGRVLLITTGACAIHCRYCFRREFPYEDDSASTAKWRPALSYIQENQSINEVILSGGDPLVLSDTKLSDLVIQLKKINHLKRIRIHTRMPVVLPDRITEDFIQSFSNTGLQIVVVIHSNHPNEIDDEIGEGLNKLKNHGMTVLNQSVLLKGVNDKSEILEKLNEKLFEYGILPYYLHMLDKVSGAAHFEVSDEKAKLIMHELRSRLPGYLVPRLVREQYTKPYKIPVM
jgi:EF-P beta-lysylation protein EpmB